MANVKVTDLPPATLPLAGDEPIMVVQAGQSRQTTVGEIAPTAAAQYLVLIPSGVLAQERVFTPTPGQLIGVDGGAGNPYTLSIDPAFFTGFANPTAQVGLVAVNGTAVTAMRSDAAPALDQAIAPTWSGQHQWALPLWAANGSDALPSYTFTSDPDTGLYRVGADSLGLSTGGTLRVTLDTANLTSTLPYLAPAGLVGTPAFAFSGDPNTGLYSVGADQLGVAAGGVLKLTVNATDLTATVPYLAPAGAVGAPAFSFSGDPNSGFYSVGADSVGLALNGALVVTWATTGTTYTVPFLGPAGSAAAPTYSFSTDPDTGIYSVGADQLGLSAGGTLRFTVDTAAITATLPFLGAAGAVGAPSLSFSGDPDTGFYSVGADNIGLATNGVLRWDVSTTAITSTLQMLAAAGAVGAPTYSFSTDPNSGLYSVGADSLGLSTNGVLRLTVDTAGVVSTLPYVAPVGAAATPSYTFTGDLNTGLYWIGADNIGIAVGGAAYVNIAADSTSFNSAVNGGASVDIINTDNNASNSARLQINGGGTSIAIFSSGSGRTSALITGGPTGAQSVIRTLGAQPIVFGTTNTLAGQIVAGGELVWKVGSVTNPSYAFAGDVDTGMYRFAADELGFACGGLLGLQISSNQIIAGGSGTAGAPRYTFFGDTDMGMYRSAADELSFATAGTQAVRIDSAQNVSFSVGGTAAAPAITFIGDSDNGLYRVAANNVGMSANGALVQQWGAGATFFPGVSTTASAANAFLNSGSSPANSLLRSTSSVKYKTDIQDLSETESVNIIKGLRPITYKSLCAADDKDIRWYGLIAEEVEKVAPRLVNYGKDVNGQKVTEGLQYERLIPILVQYARSLEKRLEVLEKKK